MKRFSILMTVFFICLSLFSLSAEAKRFGGGSSFGKQRSIPMQRQAQRQAPPQQAPAAAPAPAGNRWLGPLAGLAVGAGLASMFSGGGGMGGGGGFGSIFTLLLLVGGAMFLWSRFKNQQAPLQYAGNAPYQPQPAPIMAGGGVMSSTSSIPADFPLESFIRNGKMSFIRLQAANDRKDLDDIREYTTPEIFAEISMQLQERGNEPQKTDVLHLDAEVIEVANEGNFSIASVRFTGQLSENKGAPENIDEMWHVQKDLRDDKSLWLLAGIQQVN
ncbi:MAG: Tim44 domain-containing protein [Methylophilaceae bacterium]